MTAGPQLKSIPAVIDRRYSKLHQYPSVRRHFDLRTIRL
jgi:hypothetical protein